MPQNEKGLNIQVVITFSFYYCECAAKGKNGNKMGGIWGRGALGDNWPRAFASPDFCSANVPLSPLCLHSHYESRRLL